MRCEEEGSDPGESKSTVTQTVGGKSVFGDICLTFDLFLILLCPWLLCPSSPHPNREAAICLLPVDPTCFSPTADPCEGPAKVFHSFSSAFGATKAFCVVLWQDSILPNVLADSRIHDSIHNSRLAAPDHHTKASMTVSLLNPSPRIPEIPRHAGSLGCVLDNVRRVVVVLVSSVLGDFCRQLLGNCFTTTKNQDWAKYLSTLIRALMQIWEHCLSNTS